MKNLFTLNFIIFLLLSITIQSQDFWKTIPEPEGTMGTWGLYVAPNDNVIAACGFYDIYYSTNDGSSWIAAGGSYESNQVEEYVLTSDGIIVGCGGQFSYGLWKSDSDGVSWWDTIQYPGLHGLAINSEDIIFGLAETKVYKTSDIGLSWEELDSVYFNPPSTVIEVNSNAEVFIGTIHTGNNGGLYKSVDDGVSWENMGGDTFKDCGVLTISFGDEGEMYVGTFDEGLYKSTDNGITWVNILDEKFKEKTKVRDLEFNSKGHIFVTSTSGVFRSLDKGETWELLESGLPKSKDGKYVAIKEIAIDVDDYVYAVTNGEGAYRSTSPTTYGIQDNLALNNKLAVVNYPNPFTNQTIIHYSVPDKSFVTLKVFDVTGNEIATLENVERNKGEYKVDFETGNLPAGIYFYMLSNGNSISSGKMTITK